MNGVFILDTTSDCSAAWVQKSQRCLDNKSLDLLKLVELDLQVRALKRDHRTAPTAQ
jgi:hypothetical protein